MSGSNSYFNAAGLYAQAQAESGGNYYAQSSTSSASGAYQFLTPTWREYQTQYNSAYGTNYDYGTAAEAPPYVQDQVASITPVSNWGGSWAGSGGANAANPYYTTSTPVGVNGGGGGIASNQVYDEPQYADNQYGPSIDVGPSYDPNAAAGQPGSELTPFGAGSSGAQTGAAAAAEAGQPGVLLDEPFAVGLTSGLGQAINSWWGELGSWITGGFSGLLTSVENWFARGGLILLGIVLIAVAAIAMMKPDVTKIMTTAAASAA